LNEEKKAWLICLIVVIVFMLLVPLDWLVRGDYSFHFEKASGETDSKNAPLWHALASWFAYYDIRYSLAVLILLGIITPLLLFQVTKSWQTVLFYFGTQYFFGVPAMSHTQALAGVFLVGFLLTKNNWLRFACFVLASVSHSMGWLLVGGVWLVFLFFENLEKNEVRTWSYALIVSVAALLLAPMIWMDRVLYCVPLLVLPFAGLYCRKSPLLLRYGFYALAVALIALNVWSWYNNAPQRMAELCVEGHACGSLFGSSTPQVSVAHVAGHEIWGLKVGTIANFFLKIMPFPFLFFGLKQIWRNRK